MLKTLEKTWPFVSLLLALTVLVASFSYPLYSLCCSPGRERVKRAAKNPPQLLDRDGRGW